MSSGIKVRSGAAMNQDMRSAANSAGKGVLASSAPTSRGKQPDSTASGKTSTNHSASYDEVAAKLEEAGVYLSLSGEQAAGKGDAARRLTGHAKPQKAEGAQAPDDSIMRFVEKRTRDYMDRYHSGMDALGIDENQVLSHQKMLQREAFSKGREFTDQDKQGLMQRLMQAALNPSSDAAQEFAKQVKESHKKVSSWSTKAQRPALRDDPATTDPSKAEFFFPTPGRIKGLPGADQYPKVMAQMFPEPEKATPWMLLRAEEKLVAHIKAGLDPQEFDFHAPIAKPDVPPKPSQTRYDQQKKMIRDVFIKDMERAMDTVREQVDRKHAERAKQRAQRDAEFRAKITQHNYEASVNALESRGVTVNDDIKQAIMEREKTIEKEAEMRANSGKESPNFFQRVLQTIREVVKAVVKLFDRPVGPLPDQVTSAVDNIMAQLRTGDTGKGAKKGVEQGKTDPLAERTSEVKAKLEAAGIKFDEQQQSVTVDVSGLSTTASPKQRQDVSEQVAQKPELKSAVKAFADVVATASNQQPNVAEQQPAVQQQQSARSR